MRRTLALAALVLAPAVADAQVSRPAPPAQSTPAPAPAPAQPADPDPIVARVDGEPVRLSDVAAAAQDALPPEARNIPLAVLMQRLPPTVISQLTERAITDRALVNAARRQGLDKDPEVVRRVRRAEDQELQQALLTRAVQTDPPDAQLRERYQREQAGRQPEEEVRARHILVQTEAQAKEVITELGRGADFAEVARRRSQDNGGRDGGDLGFFKRGDMVPEFATAAFALQPGQTSREPVRSPFGWHVIRVEERRRSQPPAFEEVRDTLRQQAIEEQVEALVTRIRGEARIERLDRPAAPPAGSLLQNAQPPAPEPAQPPTRRR